MPRVQWPLRHGRPCIRIVLTLAAGGRRVARYLLADTGAGSTQTPCELLLEEQDCLACGASPLRTITLGRAYAGPCNVYRVRIQIPEIGFDNVLPVGAVSSSSPGFHGLACFRFLNRFTYGNFGDPGQFGLET